MSRPVLRILLVAVVLAQACAARKAVVSVDRTSTSTLDGLRNQLGLLFRSPEFAASQWGVEVVSLDRGETIYSQNPHSLYMPASNNKILTAAVALLRLGPDYRFETRICADGPVENGVLRGDLRVIGGGDPTVSSRFQEGDPFRIFRDWAARLKKSGISEILGNLVGDDGRFDKTGFGEGWEWDDLAYGYAAPVTALQFNENTFQVELIPGQAEGAPVSWKMQPETGYEPVRVEVSTGPSGTDPRISATAPAPDLILLRGVLPAEGEPQSRTYAAPAPTRFFLSALKQTLQSEGIQVGRSQIRVAPGGKSAENCNVVLQHASPPLSGIVVPLLKDSQNLFAETLSRALGIEAGREGSFRAGREVVEDVLGRMAVERGTYVYADGSGLSRHNLVSADQLIRILKYMYRHRYFKYFYDALPIAGVDGTVSGRMKGTPAENNVHAKTGTIAHVRSLSGYVRTADGEMVAFSMIANNFLLSNRSVEYAQDAALQILAGFSRREVEHAPSGREIGR